MIRATLTFPHGFLWGTATSSHQVEGENHNNDWSDWEQQSGRIVQGHRSGKACDWWGGRWQEDLDRAAQGGQNTHRLSVEWSRIEPNSAVWDDSAIDFYRQVLRGAIDRGLTPMVTLHHFTSPRWIMDQGGWAAPEIAARFERYVRKVVASLKDLANSWVTINEPNVYAFSGYYLGTFPPGEKSLGRAFQVMENMVAAHAAAYQAIHELQPNARVGVAHHYRGVQPLHPSNPLDRMVARFPLPCLERLLPPGAASRVVCRPRTDFSFPQSDPHPRLLRAELLYGRALRLRSAAPTGHVHAGSVSTRIRSQRHGISCQRAGRVYPGDAVGQSVSACRSSSRRTASKTQPTRCVRATWPCTSIDSGMRSIWACLCGATITGHLSTTSNGSAAGPSASDCGSWSWRHRSAASAAARISSPRCAAATALPRRWSNNSPQK